MSVYDLIISRRTIRRFKQDEIPLKILEKLVNAGRLAPSAANKQPLEFIVVYDKEVVKKVFSTLAWAGYISPRGIPPEGQQPTAYIVVLINRRITESGGIHDASAAIENIILTALEEGIGSCWIGSINRPHLAEILSIPPHCEIDSVVALGYKNESPVYEDLKNPDDSIKYYKDESGTLHVPKRRLMDILHYNTY